MDVLPKRHEYGSFVGQYQRIAYEIDFCKRLFETEMLLCFLFLLDSVKTILYSTSNCSFRTISCNLKIVEIVSCFQIKWAHHCFVSNYRLK